MTGVVLWLSGGPGIGLGHLQRGVTLGAALVPCCGPARFVIPAAARADLIAFGVSPAMILTDTDAIVAGMQALPPGVPVVLDTLHHGNAAITEAAVQALRAAGHRTAVIDSMPPDHLPAPDAASAPDLLITPYLGAALHRPPPACRWLAGAAYAMLPEAFRAARRRIDADPAASGAGGTAVLVACGGADPSGLSVRLAEIVAQGPHPIDVVVGPQFDATVCARLDTLAAAQPRVTLHHGLTSLLPLYLRAGLVIGRPGLVRYEAAVLGRSGVYLWERAEYLAYFRGFHASGVAEIYLTQDAGGEGAFLARVRALTQTPALPEVPQARAMAAVDGQGARRVAQALHKMGEPA